MFNVGPLELIVVLIIALIVLGPQRLPDVARSLGRGMREFRSALDNPDEPDDEDEVDGPEKTAEKKPEGEKKPEPEKKPEGYQKEADSSEPSSSSRDLV